MSVVNHQLLIILAWRHAWRRPFQSVLFIVGVAIGVAMIVAIDLANSSATRAFSLGTEAVAGKATHQIIGGPSGLDERVYVKLRRQLGYRLSAPVVEGYVIAEELDSQPMHLLGVDSFAEAPFRSYSGMGSSGFADVNALAAFMVQPRTILMSGSIAEKYGLRIGDRLQIQSGRGLQLLEIVNLLPPQRALDGLLICDIATAQEVLGKVGRLDRIDLIVPEDETDISILSVGAASSPRLSSKETLSRIAAILPPGARIERPAARRGAIEEMTAAFRLNLTALSLLALVVGMFLIYNTVAFSVVQRRTALGSLRAVGMTRREIFTMILAESGMLGIIGTAIGLGLGILLGRNTVQLVTRTINDLFFVIAVRQIELPLLTLFKGAVIGIGTAIFAAFLPAYEATSVPPAGAFQRSHIEDRTRAALPWVSSIGVAIIAVGILLLIPEWHLSITFGGVFAIILGIALLTPALTLGLMRLIEISDSSSRFTLHILRLAIRSITRSLSRTSVAVASLMVAISVIVGVSLMVGSFRFTIERWLTDLLQADIFVSSPSLANSVVVPLERSVVPKLAAFPGIAAIATSRIVDVSMPLANANHTIQLAAVSRDIAGEKRHYKAAIGDHATTWQALEAGGLIINEPMSNRFKLRMGDKVTLLTDRGHRQFPVVGVIYDFDVRPGTLIADRIYRKFWDDTAVSSVALFVEDSVNVDAKLEELRAAFAGELELIIRSNRALRENALAVFDRTFSITVALQMLAMVVAFIGVMSALMSLQLERVREIGTLRALGMTRRQLWKLTMLETGLMGTSAGLIAMPTGLVLAVILIYIINLRSFGWTLQMQFQPAHFLQAFIVSLVAALLAGIYPAWRMGRIQPAEALREE